MEHNDIEYCMGASTGLVALKLMHLNAVDIK